MRKVGLSNIFGILLNMDTKTVPKRKTPPSTSFYGMCNTLHIYFLLLLLKHFKDNFLALVRISALLQFKASSSAIGSISRIGYLPGC